VPRQAGVVGEASQRGKIIVIEFPPLPGMLVMNMAIFKGKFSLVLARAALRLGETDTDVSTPHSVGGTCEN